MQRYNFELFSDYFQIYLTDEIKGVIDLLPLAPDAAKLRRR